MAQFVVRLDYGADAETLEEAAADFYSYLTGTNLKDVFVAVTIEDEADDPNTTWSEVLLREAATT